jgi:hypothetical protein
MLTNPLYQIYQNWIVEKTERDEVFRKEILEWLYKKIVDMQKEMSLKKS